MTGDSAEKNRETVQTLENAIDLAPKAYDDSLDDIIGDDSDYWREDAENAYHSLTRTLPFKELWKIDNAWRPGIEKKVTIT